MFDHGLVLLSPTLEHGLNCFPEDGNSLLDAPTENVAFRLGTEVLPERILTSELVDCSGESDFISLGEHESRHSVNDEPAGDRTHSRRGDDGPAPIHRLIDDQPPRLLEG